MPDGQRGDQQRERAAKSRRDSRSPASGRRSRPASSRPWSSRRSRSNRATDGNVLRLICGGHGDGEDRRKDRGADQVAEIHRHGHGVAAGLAERRREDLDDPEYQRDFRNLGWVLDERRLFGNIDSCCFTSIFKDGGPRRCRRPDLDYLPGLASVRDSRPNPSPTTIPLRSSCRWRNRAYRREALRAPGRSPCRRCASRRRRVASGRPPRRPTGSRGP